MEDLKILICEDNAIIQHIYQEVFKNYPYIICSTGKQTVEAAIKEKFDILFLDIGLADMDGFDVGQAVLNHQENLMVIVCSANSFFAKERIDKIKEHPNCCFFEVYQKNLDIAEKIEYYAKKIPKFQAFKKETNY